MSLVSDEVRWATEELARAQILSAAMAQRISEWRLVNGVTIPMSTCLNGFTVNCDVPVDVVREIMVGEILGMRLKIREHVRAAMEVMDKQEAHHAGD